MNKRPTVAYFSMEFGLHEDFKIYSGGLGILAGDVLKAAKDEGLPMIGVGILWRQGYTSQFIDDDGRPYDCFHEHRYDFLEDTGIIVMLRIREKNVGCKVWKCNKYNNVDLYLLDTNIPNNNDTLLTGQLYGWFSEERVGQEIILGIGGVKALNKLGINVDIYHFNDSHPVFAGTELIVEKMQKSKMSFDKAWQEVRDKVVFTTHTPVASGNEVHSHALLKYMGAYNGLTYDNMVKIGGDPFSMTVAGLRLSKRANAVSKLHGETARKMWKGVAEASKIVSVTNGVHVNTWQDSRIMNAYNRKEELWTPHLKAKNELIREIFERNNVKFDPEKLIIGFARRAAAYKRGYLIFKDMNIVEPLIKSRSIQIVFAGKAHPNDLEGKDIISNLFEMSQKYPGSIIFIQNYDMQVAKFLTRGCDVWLNNPIRPMEACGTSGMKAAMNGVLNLSILDGWWPEGCNHDVNGWAIGSDYEGSNRDSFDSESLYKVLVEDVIDTFYNNKQKWTNMMTSSVDMSIENFSAARMINEYYEVMYV